MRGSNRATAAPGVAGGGIARPPAAGRGTPASRALVCAVAVLLLLLAVAALRKAWVTDDAYITFRAVDNLVEGRGLTWNPGERVQVFTHPLWMLLIAALRAVTGEFFYTAIATGCALTVVSALLVAGRLAAGGLAALAALAVLLASRAVTDYATSGLENPLVHLLLVGLLLADRPLARSFRERFVFSLLAVLCLLARPDTLWLVLPPWVAFLVRGRGRGALAAWLAAVSPLAAWVAFATLYYGTPVPNSALAKLHTGIPASEMAWQGAHYLLDSLRRDPVTLLVTLGAVGWAVARGAAGAGGARAPAAPRAWALGVVLMLAWIVRVGGDFMSGRFLTAPLVVAVGLAVARPPSRRVTAAVAAVALALVLLPATSPWIDRHHGDEWHAAIDRRGIADERAFYLKTGSLAGSFGAPAWPGPTEHAEARWLHRHWPHDYFLVRLAGWGVLRPEDGWPPAVVHETREGPYRRVFVRGAVGFLGYWLGPDSHVLDYHAITDPLLARLPVDRPDPILRGLVPRLGGLGWRVGHYYRRPPAGYVLSLATGENRFQDRDLGEYWRVLRTITSDPVFDRQRLVTLLRYWRGDYNHLLRGHSGSALRETAAVR